MLASYSSSTFPQASDLFIKFLIHIFRDRLPRLESFPNCGRVRNPQNVECIWDCEWIDNPRLDQAPSTNIPVIDNIFPDGFTYGLIKYPPDISCLEDCMLLPSLREATNVAELEKIVRQVLTERPNIDTIIIEICLLYFELNLSPCFDITNLLTGVGVGRDMSHNNPERLVGNSLTNSYTDPTLNYTLNQYPWTCSLRTAGYRGRHICGATLLSAPPSKTIIATAAHCNYICKSSEGTVRETCCCRNPTDNFASCRTVIMA